MLAAWPGWALPTLLTGMSTQSPGCCDQLRRGAVVGTADKVIPPALLTFMARRAGAHIADVNAGHLSLISKAGAVARVIVKAARATS